jgi:hypothetical protein
MVRAVQDVTEEKAKLNPLIALGRSVDRAVNQDVTERIVPVPLDSARAEWECLANSSPAADLYHRLRWIDLLRGTYRLKVFVAFLRVGDRVLAGCIFARSPNPFVNRLVALPFSDACHPLGLNELAKQELLAGLALGSSQAFEVRGFAAPRPWDTVTCFVNWRLELSRPAAQLYQNLAANFRRNVLKGRRGGVKIECLDNTAGLRRFCALHEQTRTRQGLPAQPARFFERLYQSYHVGSDFEVWMASHMGRDLGSVLVLRDGSAVYYKWSARVDGDTTGAGHLLLWSIVEAYAEKAAVLDLGRCDERNRGLSRFKRESGAIGRLLPYSFLPRAPKNISPEVSSGFRQVSARVWQHLPCKLRQAISSVGYRYLA